MQILDKKSREIVAKRKEKIRIRKPPREALTEHLTTLVRSSPTIPVTVPSARSTARSNRPKVIKGSRPNSRRKSPKTLVRSLQPYKEKKQPLGVSLASLSQPPSPPHHATIRRPPFPQPHSAAASSPHHLHHHHSHTTTL